MSCVGADQTGVLRFRASPWCGARRDHALVRGCESVPHRTRRRPIPGDSRDAGPRRRSPGIGVTTLGQFPTDIVHHSLDRLGRNRLVTHVSLHQPRPARTNAFPPPRMSSAGSAGRLRGIKPQRLPGGKSPDGRPSNNLAVPGLRRDRRSRSSSVLGVSSQRARHSGRAVAIRPATSFPIFGLGFHD